MSKTEEDEKAGGGEWKSKLKSLLNSGMHLLMYMTVYGLILFTAGLVCINGYHKKSSENNRRLAEIRQIKEENLRRQRMGREAGWPDESIPYIT